MTPRTIWLVRHGNRQDFVDPNWRQTAARPEDPGLSPDGLGQAHDLAQYLRHQDIDHILTSPFLRTLETAHVIAEALDLSLKVEAGLGEHVKRQPMRAVPQLLSRDEQRAAFSRVDAGYSELVTPNFLETWAALLRRTERTMKALLPLYAGNLLLVSHAATIKGLARSLNSKASRWDSPLGGLTQLVDDGGGWQFVRQRDVSHLRHPSHRAVDIIKMWSHRFWRWR